MRCHVEGPVDYYCGAFQISSNYWNDAGSPGSDQNDPLGESSLSFQNFLCLFIRTHHLNN